MTYVLVTEQTITPASAEVGDYASNTMLGRFSLSEAVDLCGGDLGDWHANSSYSDLTYQNHARWFTCADFDDDIITGTLTQRCIHLPTTITPASAQRIARLLGVQF